MPITLAGIALPDDIQWTDEFAGHGVGQTITPTLTGALLVEETAQKAGRPITLAGNGGAWIRRGTLEQLSTLAATPSDTPHMLTWADGRTFPVVFNHNKGALEAEEVMRVAAGEQTPEHAYLITIRLLTT